MHLMQPLRAVTARMQYSNQQHCQPNVSLTGSTCSSQQLLVSWKQTAQSDCASSNMRALGYTFSCQLTQPV
jgi:hypothetical protein